MDASLRALKNRQPDDAPQTNSSRDVHSKFTKLPIDIHQSSHVYESSDAQELTTYHIKPIHWIRHWMTECPDLSAGRGNAHNSFMAFWKNYQTQHSGHEVFQRRLQELEFVVPVLIHGDEGKTVKRTNYLVMSLESPIGSLDDPNLRCDCSKAMSNRSGMSSYGEDLGAVPDDLVHMAKQWTFPSFPLALVWCCWVALQKAPGNRQ